jgi:hypothetical protein
MLYIVVKGKIRKECYIFSSRLSLVRWYVDKYNMAEGTSSPKCLWDHSPKCMSVATSIAHIHMDSLIYILM